MASGTTLCSFSGAGFKETADVARGLADALLVLDQRDAHIAVAVLAEADARRHRDLGLLDQQLGEFDAAERLERLRDRRPGEHRGARRRHVPAGAAEAFDQHVAAAACRSRASRVMQSSGPLSAAVAATWIGVKAP